MCRCRRPAPGPLSPHSQSPGVLHSRVWPASPSRPGLRIARVSPRNITHQSYPSCRGSCETVSKRRRRELAAHDALGHCRLGSAQKAHWNAGSENWETDWSCLPRGAPPPLPLRTCEGRIVDWNVETDTWGGRRFVADAKRVGIARGDLQSKSVDRSRAHGGAQRASVAWVRHLLWRGGNSSFGARTSSHRAIKQSSPPSRCAQSSISGCSSSISARSSGQTRPDQTRPRPHTTCGADQARAQR